MLSSATGHFHRHSVLQHQPAAFDLGTHLKAVGGSHQHEMHHPSLQLVVVLRQILSWLRQSQLDFVQSLLHLYQPSAMLDTRRASLHWPCLHWRAFSRLDRLEACPRDDMASLSTSKCSGIHITQPLSSNTKHSSSPTVCDHLAVLGYLSKRLIFREEWGWVPPFYRGPSVASLPCWSPDISGGFKHIK